MSNLKHGKFGRKSGNENGKYCVLLRGKEFKVLKELLEHLNGILYVDAVYSCFDDSLHIDIDLEKVAAFYGVLRAVNRSTCYNRKCVK